MDLSSPRLRENREQMTLRHSSTKNCMGIYDIDIIFTHLYLFILSTHRLDTGWLITLGNYM